MEKLSHFCNKCKTEKPINKFYKASWCRDGYRPTCNDCRHERHINRLYDVDIAWYNEHAQDGCELCGLSQALSKRRLNVDHNHTTGKARGVLCSDCNRALGKYFEDPVMHEKIKTYLERGKE